MLNQGSPSLAGLAPLNLVLSIFWPPPKTASRISAGNNPSNHFLLLSVSRSGGARVNPRPDPIVPRCPR